MYVQMSSRSDNDETFEVNHEEAHEGQFGHLHPERINIHTRSGPYLCLSLAEAVALREALSACLDTLPTLVVS